MRRWRQMFLVIFAAGNVVTIYDLVDYVSNAGFVAGESAAAYLGADKQSDSAKECCNLDKTGRKCACLGASENRGGLPRRSRFLEIPCGADYSTARSGSSCATIRAAL